MTLEEGEDCALLGVGDEDGPVTDVTDGLATGGREAPGTSQGVGDASVWVQAGVRIH